MNKNLRRKMYLYIQYFLICFLLLSFIQVNIENYYYEMLKAESIWTQDTDIDFKNGLMDNLTIEDKGSNAHLRLLKHMNWIQKITPTSPGPKAFHEMATIFSTDKVLSFGGASNETWVFDLSDENWEKLNPLIKPPKRSNFGMCGTWDDDKIVIFGGIDGPTYLNDTWVYDFSENEWIRKSDGPNYRYNFEMINIYGTHKYLLFGGLYFDGNFYNYNDTWIYDLDEDKWTEKSPVTSPSVRNSYSMASVYNTDTVVLFGGEGNNLENDTWIYNLTKNNWIKKNLSIKPKKRAGHAMATVYGRNEIVLYGGYDSYQKFSDTWTYDINNNMWINDNLTKSPKPINFHDIASIYDSNIMVLFGGQYYDNGNKNYNETWILEATGYESSGVYYSERYDTGSKSIFNTLTWNGTELKNTKLRIQIRTADKNSILGENRFIGPDGTTSTFYSISPTSLWSGHSGDRWIQCKVIFSTDDSGETPTLTNLSVTYNLIPTTNPLAPQNNTVSNNNQPLFRWEFKDQDSKEQYSFQIIIANDIKFTNILYNTSEISTSQQQWQFPNGTSYSKINDGVWYWKIKTKDKNGGWSDYTDPYGFIIDSTNPQSVIDFPENDEYYSKIEYISGRAFDPNNGTGIEKVEISIKRKEDENYWNKFDWVPKETWLLTSGIKNWNFNAKDITWSSGNKYQISSRANDKINNIETMIHSINITYDSIKPVSNIYNPLKNSYLNNLTEISGTSSDNGGSGINRVEISIKRNYDERYWDGITWSLNEMFFQALGTSNWYFDSSNIKWSSDSKYTIISIAYDNASNAELSGNSIEFLFDDQPPEIITYLINDGEEYTNSTLVLLNLQAKDTGSGVSFISLSGDGEIWTIWEEYNNSISYQIPKGDGEKKVHIKIKDFANNTIDSTFDSIILDTSPPKELSLTINNGTDETNSINLILELQATDVTSGLDKMSFSNDGQSWASWIPFNKSYKYKLSPNNGEKTIYFRVMDKAGNIAEPISSSITLNTQIPSKDPVKENNDDFNINLMIFVLSISIIIIFITLFYLRRKKLQHKITNTKAIMRKPIISKVSPLDQSHAQPTLNLKISNQKTFPTQLPENQSTQMSNISVSAPAIIPSQDLQKKMETIQVPKLPPKNSKVSDNNKNNKN